MSLTRSLVAGLRMQWVLVYKGKGMYDDDTDILLRALKESVDTSIYHVDTVSPTDIIKGRLAQDTALLAIGGGYDLGLIEALGQQGMTNLKDFVKAGGSFLGICSGAYFACDRIEFDKGGPLEVLGERFLNFYPGTGIGPMFKPYDYQGRKGACAVNVDFQTPGDTGNQIFQNVNSYTGDQQDCSKLKETIEKDHCDAGDHPDETASSLHTDVVQGSTERSEIIESKGLIHDNKSLRLQAESQRQGVGTESQERESQNFEHDLQSQSQICIKESQLANDTAYNENDDNSDGNFSCKVYFNGGGYFTRNDEGGLDNVKVLSRYLDLPDCPAAVVRCKFGAGMAVLSGPHLEYDAKDIDDGDTDVTDIIPCLSDSAKQRKLMLRSMLQQLNITVK